MIGVSPKVCHRISAMSTATQDLQAASASSVRTLLSLLLPACFVADRGSQVDLFAVGQEAPGRADEHSEAALLQDVHVVVVGVAHRPSGRVLLGLFAQWRVDETAMTIRPVLEVIELTVIEDAWDDRVVDVPVHGDLTPDFVLWGIGASEGRKEERVEDETMYFW